MEALSRTAPAHDGLMVMWSTSEVQCGGGDTCLSRRELPSLSLSLFPFSLSLHYFISAVIAKVTNNFVGKSNREKGNRFPNTHYSFEEFNVQCTGSALVPQSCMVVKHVH